MTRWDGGKPVAALGRYRVLCPASTNTELRESADTNGAEGDALDHLWLFPATTTPGAVTLLDGATSAWVWPAGIILTDVRPIFVPLNWRSLEGAWSITCGANIAATGTGIFS